MSPQNIIAVVGATGNQGSSVAKTFLNLPNWHVRALTRDTKSASAQQLASQGAEVVQADLSDKGSLEAAFKGAAAVFVNTDFWGPYLQALSSGSESDVARKIGYDTEILHAKNAADAAMEIPELKHFVYSALGPMSKASGGKYTHCLHWETKAIAVDYIESIPALKAKASFIYCSVYHTNPLMLPKSDKETGEYTLALPGPNTTRLPVIVVDKSTGNFVRALIEDEPAGTKLLAYNADVTAQEAIAAWEKVTGKTARFLQVSLEEMHSISGMSLEVVDGPGFLGEFPFMAGVSGRVIEARDLKTKVDEMAYEDIVRLFSMDDLLSSEYPKM